MRLLSVGDVKGSGVASDSDRTLCSRASGCGSKPLTDPVLRPVPSVASIIPSRCHRWIPPRVVGMFITSNPRRMRQQESKDLIELVAEEVASSIHLERSRSH